LYDDPLVWVFDFEYGTQFLRSPNEGTAYAIAVRDALSVPEPSSVILFLMGLTLLLQFDPLKIVDLLFFPPDIHGALPA